MKYKQLFKDTRDDLVYEAKMRVELQKQARIAVTCAVVMGVVLTLSTWMFTSKLKDTRKELQETADFANIMVWKMDESCFQQFENSGSYTFRVERE